jgi:hypothetical protein
MYKLNKPEAATNNIFCKEKTELWHDELQQNKKAGVILTDPLLQISEASCCR